MAKLRSNHQKRKGPFSGLLLKVFVMFGIIAVLFIILSRSSFSELTNDLSNQGESDYTYAEQDLVQTEDEYNTAIGEKSSLIPEGPKVEVVKHKHYTLGYIERYEQAAWVSYQLTKESLRIPNVQRAKRFEIDPDVSTRSAAHSDYSRSGYSRGHMAPAGDMAFSKEAMEESMFMSNMSPQKIAFNGGIWRELEETVRDWAYENDKIYIVTGPVLNDVTEYIGKRSKVGEVEKVTGIDFYANLVSDQVEERIESMLNKRLWKVSSKREDNRIKNWNKRN